MNTIAAIIESLARAPDLILPLVGQAHPSILRRRPAPARWSLHEHACHLAEVHPMIKARLDLLLEVDNPRIASYDPGRDLSPDALLSLDLDEALRRFRSDREALVQRIEALRPTQWARTARHDEYNDYSVFIMLRHLALHDLFHAYRIEELVLNREWPRGESDGAQVVD